MKKKTPLRNWAALLSVGFVGGVIYHVAIALVALLAAFVIAAFSDISPYIAALVGYFLIRMIVEGIDAVTGLKATRCPECRRKIKTTKPIKCEECGGAAQLLRKKRKANNAMDATG